MMLAMALAHRVRARGGGGGGVRGGPARQPPGLCSLLAAIALFLVMIGSATLGIERTVDAVHNTRGDRLPAYNSAATAWKLGGASSFASVTDGFEARVGGVAVELFPKNGAQRVVQRDIHDPRSDVVRTPTTHVLYARIGRTPGTSMGEVVLVNPGEKVTVTVGVPSGDANANRPSADASRAARFAPFQCSVWSYSKSSVRDRVDCDSCPTVPSSESSARCQVACDDGGGRRRFIAQRHWVKAVTLVVEELNAGESDSASSSTRVALPLRPITPEQCVLSYHTDVRTKQEWNSALEVRGFCETQEGRTPPSASVDLVLNVRSSKDPVVVGGLLSDCSYDFGLSARENASSAIFLLMLAAVCIVAAAYWGRATGACTRNNLSDAEYNAAVRGDSNRTSSAPNRTRRSPPSGQRIRAYYVTGQSDYNDPYEQEVMRREARRQERMERQSEQRDSAQNIVEMAEVRRGEHRNGLASV